MKIIFIGGLFDSANLSKILLNSKGVIQFAADNLQKGFLSGFIDTDIKLEIINLPFIGSYPNRFKILKTDFEDSEYRNIPIKSINFINLSGVKLFSRFLNLFIFLKKMRCEEEITFVIYSLHLPFLLNAVLKKVKNEKVRVVLIVPDLPQFMTTKLSLSRAFILKFQNIILNYLYTYVDGFVILTEKMNEFLKIPISKTVVIEGIYNELPTQESKQIEIDENVINVLYAGILDPGYGVLELVNQFCEIQDTKYKLIICGAGACEEEIKKIAKVNLNVIYLGQINRLDVINLQKKCDILVNPRRPEEFTKYSFPSKTMEYLGSGVPTIMYRLEGVPDEYYDYCCVCDSNIKNDLLNKILILGNLTKKERLEFGNRARNFILKQKNPVDQIKKLNILISKIWQN